MDSINILMLGYSSNLHTHLLSLFNIYDNVFFKLFFFIIYLYANELTADLHAFRDRWVDWPAFIMVSIDLIEKTGW